MRRLLTRTVCWLAGCYVLVGGVFDAPTASDVTIISGRPACACSPGHLDAPRVRVCVCYEPVDVRAHHHVSVCVCAALPDVRVCSVRVRACLGVRLVPVLLIAVGATQVPALGTARFVW